MKSKTQKVSKVMMEVLSEVSLSNDRWQRYNRGNVSKSKEVK